MKLPDLPVLKIRIANAPCSWGVLEFPSTREASPSSLRASAFSRTAAYDQVIAEIRQSGYEGTELGDWGFMPTNPVRLRAELARHRLELIAAFVPVALVDRNAHASGAAIAVRTGRLLRDAGSPNALIVLSDDNGTVAEREQNAGRIRPDMGLTDRQWITFAAGAEHVARAVEEECGLRTVFHPHCGGYVETVSEIDELMGRTDPTLLGLCLDTGHVLFAGGDPLDVLERHAKRVWHVHFKDCDSTVAGTARASGLGYLAAVRAQLFCELGKGAVDFPAVIAALQRHNYHGWIVVEQDVFPGYGAPVESACRSREYLRALGV